VGYAATHTPDNERQSILRFLCESPKLFEDFVAQNRELTQHKTPNVLLQYLASASKCLVDPDILKPFLQAGNHALDAAAAEQKMSECTKNAGQAALSIIRGPSQHAVTNNHLHLISKPIKDLCLGVQLWVKI